MTNDFENFLEILPGRLICLDKNNTIKASNIGVDYNELLIFDILEEYEIDILKEQLEYSKNSRSSCEYITVQEKPFKKWYKNIIKPKFDNLNRFEGYTLYKEDVTEIKRLEEKLFKTNFIYYEAFEAIGIGIWELELKNNFFIVSDALKKMLNLPSVVITIESWMSKVHEDYKDNINKVFMGFIKSKEDKLLKNVYKIKVNDDYIWLKSTGKIIKYDSKGNIVKLLGIAQNITEQIIYKKSLKKYNEELEEKVNERTLELENAKREADIANMAKSEFLSNISHEFFTPLNIILNSAKIISKKIKKDDSHQKELKNIEKSGNSLNELVQKMLYLVKLDLNAIKFKMYKTDIVNLLNSVILEVRSKYDIHIKTDILSHNRYVYCDSMNIKMVILELIENSIKYIKRKENSILIEIINDKNDCILFKIQDHGIGVKKEELNSIFERFFLGSNTKDGSGGKGLGLSLCREIIKKHDGKIWAENNIDKNGLTVFFTLPIMGEEND